MQIAKSVKAILRGLYRSITRFPVTILFSMAVAGMLITISELQPIYDSNLLETLNRITMILGLGIPLSLCIKSFLEGKDNQSIKELIVYYMIGAIILLSYYFVLLGKLDMVGIARYIAVSIALYLAFLFIPYFPKKDGFEMYIIKIFTGFFTTLIYSIVLYLGLAAILFALDKLLAIHISGHAYYYAWLLVALIFAPSYFLASIPLREQHTQAGYPKLIRILFLYIVMPLLSAYTVILYIYFIKIIFTGQWPIGIVSHLVLWYSVIVAVVLFFITPIKGENKWANNFFTWLPKIIIPILIMMFFSMGIRINAYGITENRYYVIILGLWVSGIMLYFSFTKKTRNIILCVTLSLIALVSVFGPLSSFSISKMSQNNRLEAILNRNNMLEDKRVLNAPVDISKEDRNEVSRILDYFENSHSLKDVKHFPADFQMEDMERVLGFSYEKPQLGSYGEFFFFEREGLENAIDISGYDYLFDTRSLYKNNGEVDNKVRAIYNHESAILQINYDDNIIYSKDMKAFTKDLMKQQETFAKGNILPSEIMTLIEENDKVRVKLIILSISGSNDIAIGDIRVEGIEFYMLIKLK